MKNLIKQKKIIAQVVFYIAFSIELMILLIDKSALINPIEGRLFQLTFVLFFFVAACYQYTVQEGIVLFVACVIGMISYLSTERNELIRIVIFLAACKNIPIRPLMRYTFYVVLSGIGILVVLSLTGVMGVVSITDDFGRGLVETRYALGIGHPNALHCMYWSLVVLFLYLYDQKMKWWGYVILYASNFYLYDLTISKTGVIVTLFTITLALLFHYCKHLREHIVVPVGGILLTLFGIGFSIFTAIPGTFLTPESKIDKMLTGRLWIARLHGGTDQWSLFSNANCTEYFDMGYVRMFYWYGILPGAIAVIVICLLLYRLWKHSDYMGFMLVLSFVIYSTVEAHAVSVYLARNYGLFLLGTSIHLLLPSAGRYGNESDKS